MLRWLECIGDFACSAMSGQRTCRRYLNHPGAAPARPHSKWRHARRHGARRACACACAAGRAGARPGEGAFLARSVGYRNKGPGNANRVTGLRAKARQLPRNGLEESPPWAGWACFTLPCNGTAIAHPGYPSGHMCMHGRHFRGHWVSGHGNLCWILL